MKLVTINPDGGDALSDGSAVNVQRVPYRGIARVAVLVGLGAFALPFATVSCGGQKVLSATGVNGITGGQYIVSGHTNYYSGDLSLLLAVLGGVVALVILFLHMSVRARAIAAGLASMWSVAMLLVGQAHLHAELADANVGPVITVRWEAGFWIALAAFAVAAATMALQLFSIRSAPQASALAAGFSLPQTVSRSFAITASAVAAAAGALLIIVACALPYVHYTGSSIQPSSSSILNPGYSAGNWFAAEPLVVAVLALAAAVALAMWQSPTVRAVAASVILAYGVQTFLLFLGYVVLAVKSDSAQLAPGGVVGMIAGALLVAAGVAAALSLRPGKRAVLETGLPPAGIT